MRHHNPVSTSYFSHNYRQHVYEPHNHEYVDSFYNNGFKAALPKNRYVQIIQFIEDHDGCLRSEIQRGVWGIKPDRGYGSSIFAQLLYLDLIDYDKSFRYHVTDAGLKVLMTAYQNANIKFIVLGKNR